MKFQKLFLDGAFVIELEPHQDNRGYFSRLFCKDELQKAGIDFSIVQSNFSFTEKPYTLRGLHYQIGASAEKKLVKCMHGKILDVMVDLRTESETFGQHYLAELSGHNHLMVMVPEGFAHGFLTLEPNTVVAYHVSQTYNKSLEKSIRWNDPFFAIPWPVKDPILSDSDANCPDFKC